MSITMGQLASRYAQAASRSESISEQSLRTLAQAGVGLVKREIQAAHAVDTATMLNSTSAERVGNDAYLIGPTTSYATYVALGTSRMPARPFHIKAANQLRKQAADFIDSDDLGI